MVNLVVSFWLNYRIQGHFIRYKARAGSAAPQSQVSHRAPEPHSGRAALWWMAKDGKGDIFRQIERVELYFALNNVDKDHEDFTFLAWSWRKLSMEIFAIPERPKDRFFGDFTKF